MMGIQIRIYGVGTDAARHLSLLSSSGGEILETETSNVEEDRPWQDPSCP